MTYLTALRHAHQGHCIRREDWLNPPRLVNGTLEFVTAVPAYRKVSERSYKPSGTDLTANDWVIA